MTYSFVRWKILGSTPSDRGCSPNFSLNTEEVRNYIIGKTGMSSAIYDSGTHYVTNQQLTLDILKEISDSEDVIVMGEYTVGLGAMVVPMNVVMNIIVHTIKTFDNRSLLATTTTTTTTTETASTLPTTKKTLQQEIRPTSYEKTCC